MCAPVRDEKIKQLTETTDVVDTFKGILETLDLMKLDMANFTLQISKPDIIANSIEIERKKFADFLSVQPGSKWNADYQTRFNVRCFADGLQHTRNWLLKHLKVEEKPENVNYESYIRNVAKKTFSLACIDLLNWDENAPYPEVSSLFFLNALCEL